MGPAMPFERERRVAPGGVVCCLSAMKIPRREALLQGEKPLSGKAKERQGRILPELRSHAVASVFPASLPVVRKQELYA